MGGVISSAAATNMMNAQQKLLELGAKSLLPMTRPQEDSSLLTPGIIDVTGVAGIPDEEYFGPLTTIQRYDSFDEALKLPIQLVLACRLVWFLQNVNCLMTYSLKHVPEL